MYASRRETVVTTRAPPGLAAIVSRDAKEEKKNTTDREYVSRASSTPGSRALGAAVLRSLRPESLFFFFFYIFLFRSDQRRPDKSHVHTAALSRRPV